MKNILHISKNVLKLHYKGLFWQRSYAFARNVKEKVLNNFKIENEIRSVADRLVPAIMQRKNIETNEDWKWVREELIQSGKTISETNVDSIILNYCIVTQNFNLGTNYIKFLKDNNQILNLAVIGKYFRLYHFMATSQNVKTITELEILELYKEVRKKYGVLDSSTCENAILAISLTKLWKESLHILKEIQIASRPSTLAYSSIACAAFQNNENKMAWSLLEELADEHRTPNSVAYVSYLEQCQKSNKDFLQNIEKLYEFFQCYSITCDTKAVDKIISTYNNLKLNASKTDINNRGICSNCKKKLEKLELNTEQFEELKSAILKNVIVGKNVFYKSTPEELRKFENFIKNMKKYDVVIDGLNVAYSSGTKQSSHVLASLVKAVVKHFADEKKSVLLLGRTHMKNWSKPVWSYIVKNADTFLAQTLSQDDPYLLYCALHSGLNTTIVSRDLMRSHIFKLEEPRLKQLFIHWLRQNQHQLSFVHKNGKAFFKYPLPYARIAQKLQNIWHIPYDEVSTDGITTSKWLCLNN